MLEVKCNCGAESRFFVIEKKAFHLGSGKHGRGKYPNDYLPFDARCLWCGYVFEKINEAVASLKKQPKNERDVVG